MDLSITNVINISASLQPSGVGEYNTSNLAYFTSEPRESSFGSDGYKIYLNTLEVAEDFGTSSKTYADALKVFSQQPNIRAGGGYFVVIPTTAEVQSVTPSAAPTSGVYKLNYGSLATANIDWDATAAEIQAALRLVAGLESVVVTGTLATALSITFNGVVGNPGVLTVSDNTLSDGSPVTLTVAEVTAGQTLAAAITASVGLVQYFGILCDSILSAADIAAAAAVVQPLNKIAFFGANAEVDVEALGKLAQLEEGGFTHSRGLFRMDSDVAAVRGFVAAYAAKALSTNFDGSNTTQTMHLKDLSGVSADPGMTQAILAKCQTAGADIYASFGGRPKVFTSGANDFFDNVYNLLWFIGDLEVSGFNALAQVSTKLPQTEEGVGVLKSAYRAVCEQAKTNQFIAAGTWTSPTTFGNQVDMLEAIVQRGYYIYSAPVALQSPADRALRKAPLIQIAIKYAGAIHSSDVLVNVNE